jgi:hypothetical protein
VSWHRRRICALFVAAFVHAATLGCAAHTASILIHTDRTDERFCQTALEVAAHGAAEFGMRRITPPGYEPTTLPDGSAVLAEFTATGSTSTSGSRNTVYLSVFAEGECRDVSFAITDYDSGKPTEYVAGLRARLMELLHERHADATISVTETTVRTLPP